MPGTFHWVKVRLFCYSTENDEKLEEVIETLTGSDVTTEITEGHHGNSMLIMDNEMTKDKEVIPMFKNLGPDIINYLLESLDERVDDDCTFYLRLDKQSAVLGEYRVAHHGDVISITAKIVSHPAKKAVAVENMRKFLLSVL